MDDSSLQKLKDLSTYLDTYCHSYLNSPNMHARPHKKGGGGKGGEPESTVNTLPLLLFTLKEDRECKVRNL